MAEENPNIFNRNQTADQNKQNTDEDYTDCNFELTDEDGRNKIRAAIYKALTNPENQEDLNTNKYPPNVLTQLLEDQLISEYKDCEKPVYKSTANNVIKRLTGARFSEARIQLSSGEFSIEEFIKGKNPKPQRRPQTQRAPTAMQDDTASPSNQGENTVDNHIPPSDNSFANRGNMPSRGVMRGPVPARGGRGFPAPRGPRGGPPRGARGGPVMGARGGMNQSVESPTQPSRSTAPESVPSNEEQEKNIEEAKQQPAIKIPRENKPPVEEVKKVELEPEHESNDRMVIPPMRQVEANEIEPESSPVNNDDLNIEENLDDKVPKVSHRGGQPTPGNYHAQPPVPGRGRGRGHRGARGGQNNVRTPNFPGRPIPPAQSNIPPSRVEIVEDEIVHEGEKEVENVVSESPTQNKKEDKPKQAPFRQGPFGAESPVEKNQQPVESPIHLVNKDIKKGMEIFYKLF